MDIKSLSSNLKNGYVVKSISENEWEVVINTTFPNGFNAKVYIKNMAGKWFLCDKKNTLKFMNEMYELGAKDVKGCIAGILKVYGYTITAGEIYAGISSDVNILGKINLFISCMAELVNMYVFFDKP